MPRNLTQMIRSGDLAAIGDFSQQDLLDFTDATYTNILLFSARHLSCDNFVVIDDMVSSSENYMHLIRARDKFDRNIVMLAAINNNVSLLQYLRTVCIAQFTVVTETGDNALSLSVSRNAGRAFFYLLQYVPQFSAKDKLSMQVICAEPFRHFSKELILIYIVKFKLTPKVVEFVLSIIDPLVVNIDSVDDQGYSALDYAFKLRLFGVACVLVSKKLTFTPHEVKVIKDHIGMMPWTKARQKNWIKALTMQAGSSSFTGFVSKIHSHRISRGKNKFLQERERQMLREAASQLFFHLSKRVYKQYNGKDVQMIEVQLMHLRVGARSNIFVAMNHHDCSKQLGMMDLQKILTTDHQSRCAEGGWRSRRHANKLAYRVYGQAVNVRASRDSRDQHCLQVVANILRKAKGLFMPFTMKAQADRAMVAQCIQKKDCIFIVQTKGLLGIHRERHAEEFLVDIANHAKVIAQPRGLVVDSCVGGKKRPCFNCSGRLSGQINRHGIYPGLLFRKAAYHQPEAASKRTLRLLCSKPSHASKGYNRRTGCDDRLYGDYDSGSESDDEATQFSKLFERAIWQSLIRETGVSKQTLALARPEELMGMEQGSYDLAGILTQLDYSFVDILDLYRDNVLHLECLDAVAFGDFKELILDYAPDLPKIVLKYVFKYDFDLSWVKRQLDSEQQEEFQEALETFASSALGELFGMQLSEYMATSSP